MSSRESEGGRVVNTVEEREGKIMLPDSGETGRVVTHVGRDKANDQHPNKGSVVPRLERRPLAGVYRLVFDSLELEIATLFAH